MSIKGHIFCPYSLSFRSNRKFMRIILKINERVEMMLQTVDKSASYLQKSQFFCSGSRDFKRVLMTSSTCLHLHSKTIV